MHTLPQHIVHTRTLFHDFCFQTHFSQVVRIAHCAASAGSPPAPPAPPLPPQPSPPPPAASENTSEPGTGHGTVEEGDDEVIHIDLTQRSPMRHARMFGGMPMGPEVVFLPIMDGMDPSATFAVPVSMTSGAGLDEVAAGVHSFPMATFVDSGSEEEEEDGDPTGTQDAEGKGAAQEQQQEQGEHKADNAADKVTAQYAGEQGLAGAGQITAAQPSDTLAGFHTLDSKSPSTAPTAPAAAPAPGVGPANASPPTALSEDELRALIQQVSDNFADTGSLDFDSLMGNLHQGSAVFGVGPVHAAATAGNDDIGADEDGIEVQLDDDDEEEKMGLVGGCGIPLDSPHAADAPMSPPAIGSSTAAGHSRAAAVASDEEEEEEGSPGTSRSRAECTGSKGSGCDEGEEGEEVDAGLAGDDLATPESGHVQLFRIGSSLARGSPGAPSSVSTLGSTSAMSPPSPSAAGPLAQCGLQDSLPAGSLAGATAQALAGLSSPLPKETRGSPAVVPSGTLGAVLSALMAGRGAGSGQGSGSGSAGVPPDAKLLTNPLAGQEAAAGDDASGGEVHAGLRARSAGGLSPPTLSSLSSSSNTRYAKSEGGLERPTEVVQGGLGSGAGGQGGGGKADAGGGSLAAAESGPIGASAGSLMSTLRGAQRTSMAALRAAALQLELEAQQGQGKGHGQGKGQKGQEQEQHLEGQTLGSSRDEANDDAKDEACLSPSSSSDLPPSPFLLSQTWSQEPHASHRGHHRSTGLSASLPLGEPLQPKRAPPPRPGTHHDVTPRPSGSAPVGTPGAGGSASGHGPINMTPSGFSAKDAGLAAAVAALEALDARDLLADRNIIAPRYPAPGQPRSGVPGSGASAGSWGAGGRQVSTPQVSVDAALGVGAAGHPASGGVELGQRHSASNPFLELMRQGRSIWGGGVQIRKNCCGAWCRAL